MKDWLIWYEMNYLFNFKIKIFHQIEYIINQS